MIKIIISGTSDGFYPRYASDGVLDDDVSKRLVDRRDYLSKDADRLSKEGYSFQLLSNGILYHKIIPLFDAFGRDGFMMASLYLPDGEKLKGTEIKEALDAIIREYKMHTVGGMANVELDWSFVKRKADEVSTKVKVEAWRTHPSPAGSSRTALMKGADNRIAEYFEYPNPMHDGFSGYEQVFLTERLLDPALESSDGVQGYKVLTKDDVDIDNPTYDIDYVNPNGYSTMGLKHKVTKKELDVPGGFLCGELSKDGYRKRNVIIPEGKKQSEDGETIKVELPTLVPKQASVLLKVDSNTGKEIPWGNYSVSWKGSQYYDSDWGFRPSQSALFSFETVDCDQQWKVRVECDQYEGSETTVTVEDGKKEISVHVTLRYNPTWTIVVSHSDRTKSENINVPQDKKDEKIFELRSSLESEGLEVKTMPEDRDSRLVSLIATYPRWTIKIIYGSQNLYEKKEVPQNELETEIKNLKKEFEGKGLEFDKRDDSAKSARIVKLYFVKRKPTEVSGDTGEHSRRENVFKNPSRNGSVTDPPKEPEKKKWVLKLNKDSKKYSLFINYTNRKTEADKEIEVLERQCEKYQENDTIKSSAKAILQYLKDEKVEDASSKYDGISTDNTTTKNAKKLVDRLSKAIKVCEKFKKTPKVVKKPDGVSYFSDKNGHRLEICSEEEPDDIIVLGQDCYSYKLESCHWVSENETQSGNSNKVKRTLRPVYKFLWFVLPLLVIGGAGAAWYFGFRSPVNEEIVNLTKSLEVAIDSLNKYEKYYCDDALYNDYYGLPESYFTIKKKTNFKEIKELDSVYAVFDTMFVAQTKFKEADANNYAMLMFLNDSINTWDNTNKHVWERIKDEAEFNEMIAPPMSKAHTEELKSCYSARLNEETVLLNNKRLEELKEEEKSSYNRCFEASATTATCDVFLRNYDGTEDFKDDCKKVKNKRAELDIAERKAEQSEYEACMQESAPLQSLKDYLSKYQKDARFKEHVTAVNDKKAKMEQANNQKTNNGITEIMLTDNWKMDVYNSLTWGNVKNGIESYYKQYNIPSKGQNKVKNIIDRAVNQGEDSYQKAYEKAKEYFDENEGDILTHLTNALDGKLE